MTKPADYEDNYPRPLSGEKVATLPSALVPARSPLDGTDVTLEPQNAERHAQELYEASHGTEEARRIWDYLVNGPWPDAEAYATYLRTQTASFDPIYYSRLGAECRLNLRLVRIVLTPPPFCININNLRNFPGIYQGFSRDCFGMFWVRFPLG